MPTHRKIRNVSGEDLVVPWLAGRVVEADEVVLVPEEDVPSYLCQPTVWEAHDVETVEAYADVIAEAEKAAADAAAAEEQARPAPFDPGPPALGEEYVVPLADQSPAFLERQAAKAAASDGKQLEHHEQPAPAAEPAPAEDAGPLRTADAPSPATTRPAPSAPERTEEAAPAAEPAVEPATPTRSSWQPAPADVASAGYPDLAKAPAEDTVTGMLAAVQKRPTL